VIRAVFYAGAMNRIRGHEALRTRWRATMDLTTISLCVILIAMIAIVPCGCIMTRHNPHKPDEVID
jgi:hypothetical protein